MNLPLPNGNHRFLHTALEWLTIVDTLNGIGKQVVVGALVALCGFSLALLTVVPKVNTSATDITYVKKDAEEERARSDKRVSDLVVMMTEEIKLNRQIIQLVEVQNQLLGREKK